MAKKGRGRGSKNLVKDKLTGNLTNKYGVQFTQAEKKALASAVAAANRKREKMLDDVLKMPRMDGGRPTGDSIKSLYAMGKTPDFIVHKRTASLQRFQSKEQFKNYLREVKSVNNKNYVRDKVREYKANHAQALINIYGAENVKDILHAIKFMPQEKYIKLVNTDSFAEIAYVYVTWTLNLGLNNIRRGLGIKEVESNYWETLE